MKTKMGRIKGGGQMLRGGRPGEVTGEDAGKQEERAQTYFIDILHAAVASTGGI